MNRDWWERDGFLENPSMEHVIKIVAKTLFVFFAPLVFVGNLWVFYALYRGLGLAITLGISTVLFAGIAGYVDTKFRTKPHSNPNVLAWCYLGASLVVNAVIALLV
jgi:hypothetical protein